MTDPRALRRSDFPVLRAAAGRFAHVYVDRDTRRPVPVPPEIRRALERLDVSPG